MKIKIAALFILLGSSLFAIAAEFADPSTRPPEPNDPQSGQVFSSPIHPNACNVGGRRFGCDMHPLLKVLKFHAGVDFQAILEGTLPEIHAIGDGEIVKLGQLSPGCGLAVMIKHRNGLYSYGCHMSSIAKGLVPGAQIKAGTVIGIMGETGHSAGPHLHFSMATCDQLGPSCAVDPEVYLNLSDACNTQTPSHVSPPGKKGHSC